MKSLVKKGIDIRVVIGIVMALFVAVVLAFQLPVFAANTFPTPYQYELVSVNNTDGQGINGHARVEGVSSDGNKILFDSMAANLPNSSTSLNAGYMRNMTTGVTTRTDLSESGIIPDKSTYGHVMSSTGRFVAFVTSATNIIDGTTVDSSVSRLYFKDLQANTVELIADIPYSVVNNYGTWMAAQSISDDGRFVQIVTNRVNALLPGTRSGNGGGYMDAVLYDRLHSTWTHINRPISGSPQNVDAEINFTHSPAACDESLIVFPSAATNLVANYTGSGKHIFLADLRNGLDITDITPGATLDSDMSNISCNGRYIVYRTKDRSLVSPTPVGLDSYAHLVRYDRLTGERKYIDSASNGTSYDAFHDVNAYYPSVSDAGDVLLPYGITTSGYDRKIYLKHLSDGSGTLEPVQNNYAGLMYDGGESVSLVSANGKYVVVPSKDGEALGVLNSGGPLWYNILRIKTGL